MPPPRTISNILSLAKIKGTHPPLSSSLKYPYKLGRQIHKSPHGLTTISGPNKGPSVRKTNDHPTQDLQHRCPWSSNSLQPNHSSATCRNLTEFPSVRVTPQRDSKALTIVDTSSCNNNNVLNSRFPSFRPL